MLRQPTLYTVDNSYKHKLVVTVRKNLFEKEPGTMTDFWGCFDV